MTPVGTVGAVGDPSLVPTRPVSDRSVWMSPMSLLAPVCLAGVYPWLVLVLGHSILGVRDPGNASTPLLWAALLLGLIGVSAVPTVSFAYAFALAKADGPEPWQLRARRISHLAFSAPSLLVAMGNVAGIFQLRSIVPSVWVVFWVGVGALLLFGPPPRSAALHERSKVSRKVRNVHGGLAVSILVVFLLPHLSNHVAGLWSGDAHIRMMTVLRNVYRSGIVEPILVGVIVAQMASGLWLFLARVRVQATSVFDTFQTTSGVYLGVFLVSHMTAAFAARSAHVDPNWHWLTNNGTTMLGNSPNVALLPHYVLGPLLVFVHLACGLRSVLIKRGVPIARVRKVAFALIVLGAATSIVIVAGLLGVHLSPPQ